jgi:hypothetical protein
MVTLRLPAMGSSPSAIKSLSSQVRSNGCAYSDTRVEADELCPCPSNAPWIFTLYDASALLSDSVTSKWMALPGRISPSSTGDESTITGFSLSFNSFSHDVKTVNTAINRISALFLFFIIILNFIIY